MLWIIFGSLLVLFCGFICLSTYIATKNESNWHEFYQRFDESDGPYISEEALYSLIIKIKYISGILALLGLLLIVLGVITIK